MNRARTTSRSKAVILSDTPQMPMTSHLRKSPKSADSPALFLGCRARRTLFPPFPPVQSPPATHCRSIAVVPDCAESYMGEGHPFPASALRPCWTLDLGLWTVDCGLWTVDYSAGFRKNTTVAPQPLYCG